MSVNYDFDVGLKTGQRMEGIVRSILSSDHLAYAFAPLLEGRIDITPPLVDGRRRTVSIISQPIPLGHLLAVTDGSHADELQNTITASLTQPSYDLKGRFKSLLQGSESALLMPSGWFDPAVATEHSSVAFAPDINNIGQFPVCQMLGFDNGDIEVKADEKARETGNLYLEYEQQGQHATSSTPFRPSGYANSPANLWVHVAGYPSETMLIFLLPMDGLKAHIEAKRYRSVLTPSDNPSHGYLLPIPDLIHG